MVNTYLRIEKCSGHEYAHQGDYQMLHMAVVNPVEISLITQPSADIYLLATGSMVTVYIDPRPL